MAATGIDGGIDGGNASNGGGGGDATPPAITIVSPTPGTPLLSTTPIVLRITDLAPGNRYQAVVARIGDSTQDELVVWRRGGFRGRFAPLSTVSVIADGIELTCVAVGGWPVGLDDLAFAIDATDAAGNLAG